MDRLGRIRIRMHWQGQLADAGGSTCSAHLSKPACPLTFQATTMQSDNLDRLLALKNARVLRKGDVALAGVAQTQEWLVYGDTDDGNLVNGKQPRGHYFVIEGNTLVSNPPAPSCGIDDVHRPSGSRR
jgi:hypothetical protein